MFLFYGRLSASLSALSLARSAFFLQATASFRRTSALVFAALARPASLLAMTCAHGECRLLGEIRLAHRHGHVRLRSRPRASGGAVAGIRSVNQCLAVRAWFLKVSTDALL